MENTSQVCVILVAGGMGTRMQSTTPKQFLTLHHKPVVRHSYDLFLSLPEVKEIVVVCAPQYHSLFQPTPSNTKITFASPGERRQDSVYNGLQSMRSASPYVCIHDAARPFIDESLVRRVIQAGSQYGAATAAMPVKFTLKECDDSKFVKKTPDRSRLWEIQTPQVIRTSLLKQGFAYAQERNIEVTDDVSLVELLNHPVKLVEGSYKNLKITTPDDLAFSEYLCRMAK